MSKFYGIVRGAGKTDATRRGQRDLTTFAASTEGVVKARLYEHESGAVWAMVTLNRWLSHGLDQEVIATLYHGPVNEYKPAGPLGY